MAVTQYIGARYVPLIDGEWSRAKTYEPLTVVLHQGNSYTSRQAVPRGIDIQDTRFWVLTGNYNAQVEQYRREVATLSDELDDEIKNIPLASTVGFKSGIGNAEMNTELFKSIDKPIYADIDINFSSALTFTKDKYITGNGRLIYSGEPMDGYFITMEETPTSVGDTSKGEQFNVIAICNNLANGIAWHGGQCCEVGLTAINYKSNGVTIEPNSANAVPSYGNNYRIFTHKNTYESGTVGIICGASDDFYNFVESGNATVGVYVTRGDNKFGYIHGWVANPSIFADSKCVVIDTAGSGLIDIDTVFCDTMQFGVQNKKNCDIKIGHLFNFWSAGSASQYAGLDRPFVIDGKCQLVINNLNWFYKNGTYDPQTGLSNTNILIQENDKYVRIVAMVGCIFVGDIVNAPTATWTPAPTNAVSVKYTNVPTNFNATADNLVIEIIEAGSQIADNRGVTRIYRVYDDANKRLYQAKRNKLLSPLTWNYIQLTAE